MAISIETYALCKKYCDAHANTLTTEDAVAAVNAYFESNPGEIVTNSELETILENYLTEHQSLEGYATEEWVEGKNYLTEHQDISGKQDALIAGDNITIATDGKTISAAAPDLSEYAKTTEVNTAVATAVNNLVDGAPEALDTLKEIADNFSGVATQTWVEDKGYLTEHQDISGKLNILPNVEDESDPGYGYPYWIPYSFATTSTADGLDITLKTLTLDNTFRKMNFTNPFPVASATQAGIMTAADKEKLDSALQSHQDLSSYATQDWVNENYSTVALKPMKEEWTGWDSALTTAEAADAILNDEDTSVGDGFLGGVAWSDLSQFGLGNAEVKAFVIDSSIVQFEMTSSSNPPYAWFYNSASGEWRTYVPIVDNLTTNDSNQVLSAKQGKVLNDTKMPWLGENGNIPSWKTDDPGAGYAIHIPYNFTFTPDANKIDIKMSTITADGNNTFNDWDNTLPPANSVEALGYQNAGLMTSADKTKLDSLSTTVPNADASTVGGLKLYYDSEAKILYLTNDGTDPTPTQSV